MLFFSLFRLHTALPYAEMKLTFPLLNTTITVPVDDTITRGKNRRSLRKKTENKVPEKSEKAEKVDEEANPTEVKPLPDVSEQTYKPVDASSSQPNRQPVLMVEVVNVTHDKYKQTEEIKV